MAKLIFMGEKFGGRIYELAADKTTVGRGNHNLLAIHDPSVSHSHCEILVYGYEVIVRDLGSSNGTIVNGEPLHSQQRQLRDGQTVQFGSVEARLQLDAPSPDDTATAETAIFSHVRYMREQQLEPKKPAVTSATFDSGSAADVTDHTITLTRMPPAQEAVVPAASMTVNDTSKPGKRVKLAVVIAALIMGLVIFLLLVLNRQ